MPSKLLSIETLRKLLRQDPETGLLFWRERTPDMFEADTPEKAAAICTRWNTRHAHQLALNSFGPSGATGRMGGRNYTASRVAWAMHHGEWPNKNLWIKNLDGDRFNIRIDNLALQTKQEANTAERESTLLYDDKRRRWVPRIHRDGKRIELGKFFHREDAETALLQEQIRQERRTNEPRP